MTKTINSKNVLDGMLFGLLAAVVVLEIAVATTAWRLFTHLLPVLPLLTRGTLVVLFFDHMRKTLETGAQQRPEYRSIVLGLMGFSFTSLLALTVVDAHVAAMSFFPVYYMLTSFLCFYLVLMMQSYKKYEWIGQLGAALLDAATLSLLLAIVSVFLTSEQAWFYKQLFVGLALGVWLLDHTIRLVNERLVYADM